MQAALRRVCVIDDDPQVRDMMGLQLRSVGLSVDCFRCAEDFLARRMMPNSRRIAFCSTCASREWTA